MIIALVLFLITNFMPSFKLAVHKYRPSKELPVDSNKKTLKKPVFEAELRKFGFAIATIGTDNDSNFYIKSNVPRIMPIYCQDKLSIQIFGNCSVNEVQRSNKIELNDCWEYHDWVVFKLNDTHRSFIHNHIITTILVKKTLEGKQTEVSANEAWTTTIRNMIKKS